ncbi:hypothetical protein A1O1_09274 [Capronia coronata CBS 617.96]|uniref:Glycoside hydrolase family 125 protein n=1 Tax=Capronia coronata CBS 617.96 TaxID=1182541 RepID=W9XEH8_9EURO|nr:uncharacterized protein A1O1_09274 [Capronia coronata CBS 617.96]EXJ78872.1 hypothetical protein A1O1_09274 [Capronia coronata CBS 617.96]
MRISAWIVILRLSICLQIADVDAALGAVHDPPLYDSKISDQETLAGLCPDYTSYARHNHKPLSTSPLQLPFQRPHSQCRKFTSPAVEQVIEDLYPRIKDPDLAHIFRNAFPNTLDTTVLWHVDGVTTHASPSQLARDKDKWQGAQTFIVTGDINAEWLRDSTNQLAQYQPLARSAPDISNLLLGAINTQAEFVISSPYCNAFQPPDPSHLPPVHSGQDDFVHPTYEPSVVFECKYELDSLAAFLSLTNQYFDSTGSTAYLTDRWFKAVEALIRVLDTQAKPTFNAEDGWYDKNQYTFTRWTRLGTETLNLEGIGNPLAGGTGLIRSAFRPSDDATIFGFLIPANAMMSAQLRRTAEMLKAAAGVWSAPNEAKWMTRVAEDLHSRADKIRAGIYKHAVVKHPEFGEVFAYEVDGYGSHLLMDDANVPSLLSLPLFGFVDASDPIYQNTRRMVLSRHGNPYYLSGSKFQGIGGPHIGLRNAWPMSVLVQAMTSNSDTEIMECLDRVKNVSVFGLINESVDVHRGVRPGGEGMTRSWFAWANSVFAQTILWLVEEKPELILNHDGSGKMRYKFGKGWVD